MKSIRSFLLSSLAFAMVSCCTLQGANLILNPDFASGTSGWTFSGSSGLTGGFPAFGQQAYVNCVPCGDPGYAGSVSQTVATNIGDSYLVEFLLASNGSESFSSGGSLAVRIAGDTGLLVTTTPFSSANSLSAFSFVVTATDSSADFSMVSAGLAGGTFFLDNVSVTNITDTLAPEPASWVLSGAGGLLVLALRRFRAGKSETL